MYISKQFLDYDSGECVRTQSLISTHLFAAEAMQHFAAVIKRGPSLLSKIEQLGAKGNIPAFCAYQDASSFWHVTQHCPAGMTFPDLNAMVSTHSEYVTHTAASIPDCDAGFHERGSR